MPALLLALVACADGPGEPEGAADPPKAGDAATPPDWDASLAGLRACPEGDGAWRAVLGQARSAERLAAFGSLSTEIATTHPDRWEPAWAAGEAAFRQRQAALAKPHYEAGLTRARAAGSAAGIACNANRLGWFAYQDGEFPEAEALYREALEAARAEDRTDLLAFVRNNFAILLVMTGHFADALTQQAAAERGLVELGLERPARVAALNSGTLLRLLGNAREAKQVFERVYEQSTAAGDESLLDPAAVGLGNLHLDLGETALARIWYERVSGNDPQAAVRARFGLGRAALRERRWDEAAALLDEAAERGREVSPMLTLFSLISRAEADLEAGRPDAARERLEQVIAESDRTDYAEAAWAARWMLGRVELAGSDPAAAARVLAESVEILESASAPLDPLGEGLYFLRKKAEVYVDLAAAVALTGGGTDRARAERVLDVVGRAKARALSRLLADRAEAPAPRDLDTIRRGLAPGELLVDYLIGERRGVLLAVTFNDVEVAVIPGFDELGEPLWRFRESLRRRVEAGDDAREDRAAALALRSALLGPVNDRVEAADRLYVVPDRDLALLPFAALPLRDEPGAGGGYLGDALDVAMLPLGAAPPVWKAAHEPLLLAGRPRMEPGSALGELPWSGWELSRVQGVWGEDRVTVLIEDGLSRAALDGLDLGGFRTLHFATHAEASTRDPSRCGVILSGGERLGIDAIAELDLDDALVVLSACRSGEGEVVPGEGVIGIGWAFLRAGASGLVVSRWSVDDAVSARLMVAFHQRLKEGDDPVRALGRARRAVAAEHPHPAYWAPFAVVLRPS